MKWFLSRIRLPLDYYPDLYWLEYYYKAEKLLNILRFGPETFYSIWLHILKFIHVTVVATICFTSVSHPVYIFLIVSHYKNEVKEINNYRFTTPPLQYIKSNDRALLLAG